MARTRSPRPAYTCSDCGWQTSKWAGRCGQCQAWGTLVEAAAPTQRATAGPVSSPAMPIGQVAIDDAGARPSGVPELDRVLGGGVVPGAVLLLAGEPGVGKSTLLLEVAAQSARGGAKVLYVTGEESASQVRLRADRCRAIHPRLYLAAETDLGAVLTHIEEVRPDLLVIDSVQTIGVQGADGVPGGVTQVKEVSAAIVRMAKTRDISTVLVGHVTKEGTIAGPRVLEHLVDVVLHFEGEKGSQLRVVRAIKNRYGPVDEVGCFRLSGEGIIAVDDPSGLFVSRHHEPVSGTCITVTLEGRRPMLAELQALVTHSADKPRRGSAGLDTSRLNLLLAVLQQRGGLRLWDCDVFVSTVGGARLAESSTDLAVAMAVASAAKGIALRTDMLAIGEIGLAGELRRVPDLPRRLTEAARLGFKAAIVPPGRGSDLPQQIEAHGLRIFEAPTLVHALHLVEAGASMLKAKPMPPPYLRSVE